MRKTIMALLGLLVGCAASFACSYDSATHTVTNCRSYEEGIANDDCKAVHRMYEKWVAKQALKATEEKATQVKEAAVNTYNDFMESDTGKAVSKKARETKDKVFEAIGNKFKK